MVLTNFECWAHGEGDLQPNAVGALFERRNRVDLFNPSVLQACGALNNNANNNNNNNNNNYNNNNALPETLPPKAVTHISSNGYYGFSYVNQTNESGNDVNIAAACMGASEMDDVMDVADNVAVHLTNESGNFPTAVESAGHGGACAAGVGGCEPERRKRFFNGADFVAANQFNAKRCRFDNEAGAGCAAAQLDSHLHMSMETETDTTTGYSMHDYRPQHNIQNYKSPLVVPKLPQECELQSHSHTEIVNNSNTKSKSQIRPTINNNEIINSNYNQIDSNSKSAIPLEDLFLLTHGGGDGHLWRHIHTIWEEI